MSQPSYPPELAKTEFSCAHCSVYSAQAWYIVAGRQGNWRDDQDGPQPHSIPKVGGGTHHFVIEPFSATQNGRKVSISVGGKAPTIPKGDDDLLLHDNYISVCFHCGRPSLWERSRMVCPSRGAIEAPNPDLDKEIQEDYLEAASVIQQSPRAAAAILRMCIQKMTKQLGLPGKNINDDIATLVKNGLNPEIQQALDFVRVVGNNAVHPLEMDLRDDLPTANALFGLVNLIAEQMISRPRKIAALFSTLPHSALAGIAKRDGT